MHPSVTHGESERILGVSPRAAAQRYCLILTCVKRSPYWLRDGGAGLHAAALPAQCHTSLAKGHRLLALCCCGSQTPHAAEHAIGLGRIGIQVISVQGQYVEHA